MENKGINLMFEQVLDCLEELYEQLVNVFCEVIVDYVDNGMLFDFYVRFNGLFVYFLLFVSWDGVILNLFKICVFGCFIYFGCYIIIVMWFVLFCVYFLEQFNFVYYDYGVYIVVEVLYYEILYFYVIDGLVLMLDCFMSVGLMCYFFIIELVQIGDEMVDGLFYFGEFYLLLYFDVCCVDFLLVWLWYYIGMLVEYFQFFVLFINYICYVDEFVCWGCS